jgi:hypothetical protein
MAMPRVVIVEGIMGSGKSTTARYLAQQFHNHQLPAHVVFEGTHPHPVRLLADLPHPFQPWLDETSETYIARSLAKWSSFAERMRETNDIMVFDGQLFHGDFTNLFMMDTAPERLYHYTEHITTTLTSLQPALIYFYQDNLAQALQLVFRARGPEWERYQVDWKMQSPYCVRHNLHEYAGLVQMYTAYRALTDAYVTRMPIATLSIENSAGEWLRYYQDMHTFLQFDAIS